MNALAIVTPTLPHRIDCEATTWASLFGASMFAVAVVTLEVRLRVPVRPLLDVHLQAVLSRASFIAVAFFRTPTF